MAAKNNKTYYIIGAVIVVLVVYFFVVKPWLKGRSRASENMEGSTSPTATGSSPTGSSYSSPSSQPFDGNKLVDVGSKGQEVEYVQRAVNRVKSLEGKEKITVDGIYGSSETKPAVVALMGKSKVSYNQVKDKVIAKYAAAGKPNPYLSKEDQETVDDLANTLYWSNPVNWIDPFGLLF